MTIYCFHPSQLTPPEWDKSGEKRVMLSKAELRRYKSADASRYLTGKAKDKGEQPQAPVDQPKRRRFARR